MLKKEKYIFCCNEFYIMEKDDIIIYGYYKRKGIRDMFRLSILEFFLIVIPESYIYIIGIYFLTKKLFNKKKLIIMSLLLAIEVYCVRMLPIHFGIHIFINIIFATMICVNIGKVPIRQAISYNLIMIMLLSINEFISFFILINIFKINISLIKLTPLTKALYFIPSFVLFTFSIYIISKFIDIRK